MEYWKARQFSIVEHFSELVPLFLDAFIFPLLVNLLFTLFHWIKYGFWDLLIITICFAFLHNIPILDDLHDLSSLPCVLFPPVLNPMPSL